MRYSKSAYALVFNDIPLEELICVRYDPEYHAVYRQYLCKCTSKCVVLHIADGRERLRVTLLLSHVSQSIDEYLDKIGE